MRDVEMWRAPSLSKQSFSRPAHSSTVSTRARWAALLLTRSSLPTGSTSLADQISTMMKQTFAEDFVGRAEFVAKYQANTTAESANLERGQSGARRRSRFAATQPCIDKFNHNKFAGWEGGKAERAAALDSPLLNLALTIQPNTI